MDDNKLDSEIKRVLEKQLAEIEIPADSKERIWARIQENSKHKRKIPFNKFGIIAASLLFLAISILPFSQHGSAFEWFNKFVLKTKGTSTNLVISTSDKEANNSTPLLIENESSIFKEVESLDEAKTMAKFSLRVPDYIPKDYSLENINIVQYENELAHKVVITYSKNSEFIKIEERLLEGNVNSTLGVDNEDTIVKEVKINGENAYLFIFKDKSNKIMWNLYNLSVTIDSKLEIEELLKLAESI